MEVKEALLKRRSIRKFKDTPVTDEQIKALLEAAMSAPSGCNYQPWKFYVITNKELLAGIRDDIPRAGNYPCPLAILVTGDTTKTQYWRSDCGAATENILLRAVDLGLGTLWLAQDASVSRVEAMKKRIKLKEGEEPFSLIYVGVPDVNPEPRTQYDEAKIEYIK